MRQIFTQCSDQGIENIAADEIRARESHGKDVNTTLKNNIEGIILKWSYQVNHLSIDGFPINL